MDLLPSIDELRDELLAHDLAVREIIALDQYIEKQLEQTFLSNMRDCEVPPFSRLIRIQIAEGNKRMFKEYRLLKWLKVQEIANKVRTVLNTVTPAEESTDIHPTGYSSPWQQPDSFSNNTVVPTDMERSTHLRPVNTMLQMSPVTTPLLRLLSPINTPQIPVTGQTYHSSPHIINRQLFPESQCPENSVPQQTVPYQTCRNSPNTAQQGNNGEHLSSHPGYINFQHMQIQELPLVNTIPSVIDYDVHDRDFQNQQSINQPDISTMVNTGQEHLGHFNHEQLNDINEEMDLDSDYDSSYDEEDENLAGVLFATQTLLPEEQAVRLDVEMGDMGVGHIQFDRISAAWNRYQCSFHRAG